MIKIKFALEPFFFFYHVLILEQMNKEQMIHGLWQINIL